MKQHNWVGTSFIDISQYDNVTRITAGDADLLARMLSLAISRGRCFKPDPTVEPPLADDHKYLPLGYTRL